ncbi:nitroreductase family protein [Acidobacteriia bacterium AH_259_A11_L15]|nr:nitroreductase family protein [Acidobacteriia bacterium AH_259_A11_L15]
MSKKGIYPFLRLQFERLPIDEQRRRAAEFETRLKPRRTVREFSPDPVPFELIEAALRIAGRAPSGANQQPWHFVVVSNPEIKRQIREAAESEERENYNRRFPDEWLQALAHLGTDWHKAFLEVAPYLIVVFREDYGIVPEAEGGQRKVKHYYVQESVGIACGFLIAALHWMGLASLTHTPSPMGFLSRLLKRPPNQKPYLLIPVGYPAAAAEVPDIPKKSLDEIVTVVG